MSIRAQSMPLVTARWLDCLNTHVITGNPGKRLPLVEVAEIRIDDGRGMIKTENARLIGWTFIDIRDRDLGSYVAEAQRDLNKEDIHNAVIDGALLRVRPIMLGGGTGSEVMRRIAAPMVGGMVSATLLTLVVIPAVFLLWKQRGCKS